MLAERGNVAAQCRRFVAQWQPRVSRDWLLMYSAEGGRLTALSTGRRLPPGLQVDAEYPEELLAQMGHAARAWWQSPAYLARLALSQAAMSDTPSRSRGAGR